MIQRLLLLSASLWAIAGAESVTFPMVSGVKIPVRHLTVSETAYAAIRKPPGDGPFPAVIFLHGGLGQSQMANLRQNSLRQPTQGRFLAWGYVTVTATRRAHRHDPQDRGVVGDTLDLVRAVRKLPYVDSESICLYGGSGGGTLALEVASVTDDVAAIVAGEPATVIYMGMFSKDHVVFGEDGKPTGDRRWDVMNADPRDLYTDALREHTRAKLSKLSTPTLILHGDVHALKKFNLDLFVPEMEALGKPVTVKMYAGEPHGFYWGRGRDPGNARQANEDAHEFLQRHVRVQPKPLDASWTTAVEVGPMRQADPN